MSDKVKTLSQAIRLGATFHPQCFNSLYYLNENYQAVTHTCALGAATEAVLGYFDSFASQKMVDRFPELNKPLNGDTLRFGTTLRQWIINRNDKYKWSREKIADELEARGY